MSENSALLYAKGICKQFGGIEVLKNVDLEIERGEVHALMGENGAGKSTVIKIITGVYTKDSGEIFINGKAVEIGSRQDARALGISVIYQELSLIPALTVAENIFLGQEITQKGVLAKKKMNAAVKELIDKYGFDLKPKALVESLGMAKRQMVEILKALSANAELIIMDEPTASLSAAETEKLFDTIEGLKKKGAAILYISHRLEEVYRIADRLTVMRDGENVGVLKKADINAATVTKMMIGREIRRISNRDAPTVNKDMCLAVNGLSYKKMLDKVDFAAYGGEVLGIGGLVGSGRTEFIKCLYGALKPDAGAVTLCGKPIQRTVGRNIKNGFGLVPEDRRREGFVPILSVERNLTAAGYDILAKAGVVSRKGEIAYAEKAIKDYDIRPALRRLPVGNLSGGNQQKVVLGRWLSRELKVLLLDEPTAGVDIGVKEDLYNYIWDLAASGAIVIMVSSDLEELIYVSDRILVMYGGRFFEEFSRESATQETILLASSGVRTENGRAL
jgi:ribose transport system ATP-binding protein